MPTFVLIMVAHCITALLFATVLLANGNCLSHQGARRAGTRVITVGTQSRWLSQRERERHFRLSTEKSVAKQCQRSVRRRCGDGMQWVIFWCAAVLAHPGQNGLGL